MRIEILISVVDGALSQSTQRKPIVWKESKEAADAAASASVAGLSQTVSVGVRGGRARARRARYATAAAYSRGRGETTWVGGQSRRGRGAARRRSMY